MPPEKPIISSVFLVLSPVSSLFQKSEIVANKKMPTEVFDLFIGFELLQCKIGAVFHEFFHEKLPFFRFINVNFICLKSALFL